MTAPTSEALDIAAELCRVFEGLSLKPYICPAGYPTIGYGTVWKPDGSRVTLNDPNISQDNANEWLLSNLLTYQIGVLKLSPHLIAKPAILGAITDFAYNLGVARYSASTLKRRINTEDWDSARVELGKWIYGGGRSLPGLVRRRAAEASLF